MAPIRKDGIPVTRMCPETSTGTIPKTNGAVSSDQGSSQNGASNYVQERLAEDDAPELKNSNSVRQQEQYELPFISTGNLYNRQRKHDAPPENFASYPEINMETDSMLPQANESYPLSPLVLTVSH